MLQFHFFSHRRQTEKAKSIILKQGITNKRNVEPERISDYLISYQLKMSVSLYACTSLDGHKKAGFSTTVTLFTAYSKGFFSKLLFGAE